MQSAVVAAHGVVQIRLPVGYRENPMDLMFQDVYIISLDPCNVNVNGMAWHYYCSGHHTYRWDFLLKSSSAESFEYILLSSEGK